MRDWIIAYKMTEGEIVNRQWVLVASEVPEWWVDSLTRDLRVNHSITAEIVAMTFDNETVKVRCRSLRPGSVRHVVLECRVHELPAQERYVAELFVMQQLDRLLESV